MTALAAPWTAGPSLGRTVWAVVWGCVLGAVALGGLLFGLMLVGVPVLSESGATGWGTPWRVEGLWSFAANLGPLAVFGVVFAALHPLEAGRAELNEPAGEAPFVDVTIVNRGGAGATVLAMRVPSPRSAQAILPRRGMRIAGGASVRLPVSLPGPCSRSWRLDRVEVRLRVHGREVGQVVRLAQPLVVPCG